MTQSKYFVDLLKKTKMECVKACFTVLVAPSKTLSRYERETMTDPIVYCNTIRAVQYLTMKRPDMSYILNKLS